MKILLVDSSYPINTRNSRLIETFQKNGCKVRYATWNRNNDYVLNQDKSNYIMSTDTGYGKKLKKLFELKKYFNYLKFVSRDYMPEIIIASHWDNLLLMSLLKKDNQKLIYENLDLPTSNNIVIRTVLERLEKAALRKVDTIICASRFFPEKYKSFKNSIVVFENYPSKTVVKEHIMPNYLEKDILNISFIGTIRYYNILKNLADISDYFDINVSFFGAGPDSKRLNKYLEKKAKSFSFGRYEYDDIQNIYRRSDIIWAAYPSKDFNVKYAISNKFFECLVFEKPILVSSKTKLGEFIENHKLGFTVDPYDIEDLKRLIQKIINNKEIVADIINNIKSFKTNNSLFWEDNENKIIDVVCS